MTFKLLKTASNTTTVIVPRTDDLIRVLEEDVAPAFSVLFKDHPELSMTAKTLAAIYSDRADAKVFLSFSAENLAGGVNPLFLRFSPSETKLLSSQANPVSSIQLDNKKLSSVVFICMQAAIHRLKDEVFSENPELLLASMLREDSASIVRTAADSDKPEEVEVGDIVAPRTGRKRSLIEELETIVPDYKSPTHTDLIEASAMTGYAAFHNALTMAQFASKNKDEVKKIKDEIMTLMVAQKSKHAYYSRSLAAIKDYLSTGRKLFLKNGQPLISNPPVGPFLDANAHHWRSAKAINSNSQGLLGKSESGKELEPNPGATAAIQWVGGGHESALRFKVRELYGREMADYGSKLSPEEIEDFAADPGQKRAASVAHRELASKLSLDPARAKKEMDSFLLDGFTSTISSFVSNGVPLEQFQSIFSELKNPAVMKEAKEAMAEMVALLSGANFTSWESVAQLCTKAVKEVEAKAVNLQKLLGPYQLQGGFVAKLAQAVLKLPLSFANTMSSFDYGSVVSPDITPIPKTNTAVSGLDQITVGDLLPIVTSARSSKGFEGYTALSPSSASRVLSDMFKPRSPKGTKQHWINVVASAVEAISDTPRDSVKAVRMSVESFKKDSVLNVGGFLTGLDQNLEKANSELTSLRQKIAIKQKQGVTHLVEDMLEQEKRLARYVRVCSEVKNSNLLPADLQRAAFVATFMVSLDLPQTEENKQFVSKLFSEPTIVDADILTLSQMIVRSHHIFSSKDKVTKDDVNMSIPTEVAKDYMLAWSKYEGQRQHLGNMYRNGNGTLSADPKSLATFMMYSSSDHAVNDILETEHIMQRGATNEQNAKSELVRLYNLDVEEEKRKTQIQINLAQKAEEIKADTATIVGITDAKDGEQTLREIQEFMLKNGKKEVLAALKSKDYDDSYYDAFMVVLGHFVGGLTVETSGNVMSFANRSAEKVANRFRTMKSAETSGTSTSGIAGEQSEEDDEGGGGGSGGLDTVPEEILADMRNRTDQFFFKPKITDRGFVEQYSAAGFFAEYFAKKTLSQGKGDEAKRAAEYVERIVPKSSKGATSPKFARLMQRRVTFAVGANFGRNLEKKLSAMLQNNAESGLKPTNLGDFVRDMFAMNSSKSVFCDPIHAAKTLAVKPYSPGDTFYYAHSRCMSNVGPYNSEELDIDAFKEHLGSYYERKRKDVENQIAKITNENHRQAMLEMMKVAPGSDIGNSAYTDEQRKMLVIIGKEMYSTENNSMSMQVDFENAVRDQRFQTALKNEIEKPAFLDAIKTNGFKTMDLDMAIKLIRSSQAHRDAFEVERKLGQNEEAVTSLFRSVQNMGFVFAGFAPRKDYSEQTGKQRIKKAIKTLVGSDQILNVVKSLGNAKGIVVTKDPVAMARIIQDSFYVSKQVEQDLSEDFGDGFVYTATDEEINSAIAEILISLLKKDGVAILGSIAIDETESVSDFEAEEEFAVKEAAKSFISSNEELFKELESSGVEAAAVDVLKSLMPKDFILDSKSNESFKSSIETLKASLVLDPQVNPAAAELMTSMLNVVMASPQHKARIRARMDDGKEMKAIRSEFRQQYVTPVLKSRLSAVMTSLDMLTEKAQHATSIGTIEVKAAQKDMARSSALPMLNQLVHDAEDVAKRSAAGGLPVASTKRYYSVVIQNFNAAKQRLQASMARPYPAVSAILDAVKSRSMSVSSADQLKKLIGQVQSSNAPAKNRISAEPLYREMVAAFAARDIAKLTPLVSQVTGWMGDEGMADMDANAFTDLLRAALIGKKQFSALDASLKATLEGFVNSAKEEQDDELSLTPDELLTMSSNLVYRLVVALKTSEVRIAEMQELEDTLNKLDDSDLNSWRNEISKRISVTEEQMSNEDNDKIDTTVDNEEDADEIAKEMLSTEPVEIDETEITEVNPLTHGQDYDTQIAEKEYNLMVTLLGSIGSELQAATAASRRLTKLENTTKEQLDQYKAALANLLSKMTAELSNKEKVLGIYSRKDLQNIKELVIEIMTSVGEEKKLDLDKAEELFDTIKDSAYLGAEPEEITDADYAGLFAVEVEEDDSSKLDEIELQFMQKHNSLVDAAVARVNSLKTTDAAATEAAKETLNALRVENLQSAKSIKEWLDEAKAVVQYVVRAVSAMPTENVTDEKHQAKVAEMLQAAGLKFKVAPHSIEAVDETDLLEVSDDDLIDQQDTGIPLVSNSESRAKDLVTKLIDAVHGIPEATMVVAGLDQIKKDLAKAKLTESMAAEIANMLAKIMADFESAPDKSKWASQFSLMGINDIHRKVVSVPPPLPKTVKRQTPPPLPLRR